MQDDRISLFLIVHMFEQIFKNIDDILFKDSVKDSELDDYDQTSFLFYLLEIVQTKADEASLELKKANFHKAFIAELT